MYLKHFETINVPRVFMQDAKLPQLKTRNSCNLMGMPGSNGQFLHQWPKVEGFQIATSIHD